MVSTTMKFALVTGAGSGIGRAAAQALMAAGYCVALVGRRAEALEETAAVHAERAWVLPADVTDAAAVATIFARVQAEFGRLDLLFNNAGISAKDVAFEDLSLAQWQAVVDVNLTGSFLCAQAAFKLMKAQSPRGGRIINNGSISAYAPRPHSAPYTATKHAVTGLTKALSLDGRPYNIACGQLDIGNALTDMALPMTQGVRQANGAIAVEATMDVTHAASAVVYMAGLPLEANVQFMTVMATKMPFIGRG